MDNRDLKLYYGSSKNEDDKNIIIIFTCEEGIDYVYLDKTTFEVLHTC